MSSLAARMRKSRESNITLGPFKLTIRRPTDLQALELRKVSGLEGVEKLSHFVVDWSDVKELDLLPGGTGELVPFDRETFMEWISDHPELWVGLIEKVMAVYQAHVNKRSDSTKN